MLKEALGPELHGCKVDRMPPDSGTQVFSSRSEPPPNAIVEVRCARCAPAFDREPVLAVVVMIPGRRPGIIPLRRMGNASPAPEMVTQTGFEVFLRWASGEGSVPALGLASDFVGTVGDLVGALQDEPEWDEWDDQMRAKCLALAEACHQGAEVLAAERGRLAALPITSEPRVILRCDSHRESVNVGRAEVIQEAATIVNAARPRLRVLSDRGQPAGCIYVGAREEAGGRRPFVVASA